MKTAQVNGEKIVIKEIEDLKLNGKKGAIVKVLGCGLCGSGRHDVHIVKFHSAQRVRFDLFSIHAQRQKHQARCVHFPIHFFLEVLILLNICGQWNPDQRMNGRTLRTSTPHQSNMQTSIRQRKFLSTNSLRV